MSREENLMLIGSCKTIHVTVNIFFSTKHLDTESPFSYPSRFPSIICVASAPFTGQIQRLSVSLLVVHPRPLRPFIAPPDVGVSLHAPHNMVAVRASIPSPITNSFGHAVSPSCPRTNGPSAALADCLGRLPWQGPSPWLRHRHPTPYSRPRLSPPTALSRCATGSSPPSPFRCGSPICRSLRARRRVGRRAGGSPQIRQAETSSLRKGARLRRCQTQRVLSASGGTPPHGATRVRHHWPSLASSACRSRRQRRRPTGSARRPTREKSYNI